MKRIFSLFAFLLTCSSLNAAPLWMRYPSISPDGKSVAFAYKGDIYTVSSEGGRAQRLTTDPAQDFAPVWSPDGSKIAFASDRYGNFDVYLVDALGGVPQRLTTHSGAEIPYCFTRDGHNILFGASIADPVDSMLYPNASMKELYSVPVTGGRPEQILAVPAEKTSFSHTGSLLLYQDKKGGENEWRKHHQSSITRDIWLYDTVKNKHTRLTSFAGEDRDPLFSPDDNFVYYLSERNGSFNVWRFNRNKPQTPEQITNFKTHPVRFLSMANDGTLCYGYNGNIYVQPQSAPARRIKVNITGDISPEETEMLSVNLSSGTVSDDGKQIAFVNRGDIFVTSVAYSTTKQITSTPEQESAPVFSPDARTLAYTSERNGNKNIYLAKIARKEDPNFPNAMVIDEKPLIKDAKHEREHPQFSPDGKEMAFVEDRSRLMVMNLQSGAVRQITDGTTTYGTSGQIDYEWSPDGKWFTLSYTSNQHDPYTDIGIVSTEGKGKILNLTNSGYTDNNPRWVLDGNAILFQSERFGMRNHASWGSLTDSLLIFLNQEAYERFNMSKEDREIYLASDKAPAEEDKEKKKKPEAPAPIQVELKDIAERIIRLTPSSCQLGDAILDKNGENLYYVCAFQKGFDLWQLDLRNRSAKIIRSDVAPSSLQWDQKMEKLFILGKKPAWMKGDNNALSSISAKAERSIDLAAERAAMFEHVCKEEQKRFYTEDMHGVDWKSLRDNYARFLPHINNNYDFAEMLSELLGELNVSHTGSSFRKPTSQGDDSTAELGLFFDPDYKMDGLRIQEVVRQGPFDKSKIDIRPGDILESINGTFISSGMDYFPLLNHQAGQKILISLYRQETQKRWDEVITPITKGNLNELLYNRWVKQCEEAVDRLSGGRLGYVHIQAMGDPSFRTIYSAILGKYNDREGIVIDTRFNGGGRLHEDIEVLFSGKKYFTQVIRGKESCDMPSRRWNKPSIMLTCEANYSNAHGTPWVYRNQGIGKLVGMPVPGTMTSVCWETLQDPSLLYGIPVIGYRLPDGSYLENTQLEPDIKVANSPEKIILGKDEQLEIAVKALLQDIDKPQQQPQPKLP